MNSKMTTNSQLLTTKPKNKTQKQTKQTTKQEQTHRNGDHMEGCQQGNGTGRESKRYRE